MMHRLASVHIGLAVAFIALALMPLWISNPYVLSVLTLAALYAIFASSWDILSGYIGQLNFGHAVFFGVGAYATGFLGPHLHPLFVLLRSEERRVGKECRSRGARYPTK